MWSIAGLLPRTETRLGQTVDGGRGVRQRLWALHEVTADTARTVAREEGLPLYG